MEKCPKMSNFPTAEEARDMVCAYSEKAKQDFVDKYFQALMGVMAENIKIEAGKGKYELWWAIPDTGPMYNIFDEKSKKTHWIKRGFGENIMSSGLDEKMKECLECLGYKMRFIDRREESAYMKNKYGHFSINISWEIKS